jgi:hypothetical protein
MISFVEARHRHATSKRCFSTPLLLAPCRFEGRLQSEAFFTIRNARARTSSVLLYEGVCCPLSTRIITYTYARICTDLGGIL